ncbi:MAG: LamG domain-containing protein, partial [Williamsia herbipolensis]|nr:LamG domain-containing protein [Williamsia herbipolensis]
MAALDASTGALIGGFGASIGGTGVYAMTATADVLYVGGLFTQAGGVARKNLAAFATSSGALLGWAPTTDLQTDAMVMDPSKQKVIVGGRFAKVNNVAQRGLAALDPSSGAIVSWGAPATIQNGISTGGNAGKAGIFSLTADSGAVYGTGWSYAGAAAGNLEGTFAAESGSGTIRWVADCHGDHYGVYSTGSVVYTTSHVHACETVGEFPDSVQTHKYAEAYTADARGILTRTAQAGANYKDWSGTPSPAPYNWYPDFTVGKASGLGQAGLSVTGSGGYISIGGEFGSVNNRQFQGLVRFAVTPTGQGRMGPRLSGADWTGSAASPSGGTVRVSIPANWDRDDLNLTYDLYREGVASPVQSVVARSTWWDRPLVGLTETGLSAGSTPRYRVVVRDADGNQVSTDWMSVTVSGAARSAYADQVLLDGANSYWRLGADRSNAAGGLAPRIGSGVSTASSGAIASDGAASNVDGTSSGTVGGGATTAVMSGDFAVESWVKTTSTRGGELAGFGNAASGNSGTNDRVLYLQSNGRATFGMVNGAARTVVTGPAVNDGRWHHVVGVVSPGGMSLYVDGSLAAQDPSVVAARLLSGYWRAGGDNLSGWPNRPASDYLSGQIDEVAAYPTALTASQVAQHTAVA